MNAQTTCPYPTGWPTLCSQYTVFSQTKNIITATSTSTLTETNWTGERVYLNATLTVDNNFTFYGSKFKMGPNGKIVVNNGQLQSSFSQFFSCESTGWPGIVAGSSSQLSFYWNYIEDAQVAIDITSSSAVVKAYFNYINRNDVGIWVRPGVAANMLAVGNTFDCTSNTYTGGHSAFGIKLQNSFIAVGLPQIAAGFDTYARNIFRNNIRHIEATSNATLNLRYAELSCATSNAIYGSGGSRINVLGSVSSSGVIKRNSFLDNMQDIRTTGCPMEVRYSDFTGCLTNNLLSGSNTNQQIINIRDNNIRISNSISNDKNGITLDRSSGGGPQAFRNTIERNQITIDDFSGANARRSAIAVTGFPGTPDNMMMRHNVVIANPGGGPSTPGGLTSHFINIEINQSGGYNVLNNRILSTNVENANNSRRWGFYLHGWESPSGENVLYNNSVQGGTGPDFDYGLCCFHFIKAGPWGICSDTTNNTLRGFHVNDFCFHSRFGDNMIGVHQRSIIMGTGQTAGLLMESGSNLGPQACRGNQWTFANYTPDIGAWHKGTNFLDSKFDYNPLVANSAPVPVNPTSGWFVADACVYSQCIGEALPPGILDEFEQAKINANQTYTPPVSVLDWEVRREVLVKLIHYPQLKTSYPPAQTFYNAHINTSAGLFAQFDESLYNAMLIAPAQSASLGNLNNQLQTAIAKIDSLDGTLRDSFALKNAGTTFFNYRYTLLQQWQTLSVQEESLLTSVGATRQAALQACSTAQAALPQTAVYERNQKFLNGLAIKKAQEIPYSATDYTNLQTIAQQCPEVAGYTRNRAMNQLSSSDPLAHWSDEPVPPGCIGMGDREDAHTETIQTADLQVYPNPAQDELIVRFGESFSGDVSVFDLSGRQVLSRRGLQQVEQLPLSVNHLNSGIFFLTVISESGASTTVRFIIVK
ncbi:MAG: T9SS type A sorting domain-containing protein [Saprospiraceae bacterium]|nr:T9SS type A sorting domain-containing protein [Saprospiraceae bacterium]